MSNLPRKSSAARGKSHWGNITGLPDMAPFYIPVLQLLFTASIAHSYFLRYVWSILTIVIQINSSYFGSAFFNISARRLNTSADHNTLRLRLFLFQIQNTQEIKRTLFNWTKQDKTCNSSRMSSFSSYALHKKRKTNNSTYLVSAGCGRLAEGKGLETDFERLTLRD